MLVLLQERLLVLLRKVVFCPCRLPVLATVTTSWISWVCIQALHLVIKLQVHFPVPLAYVYSSSSQW